MLEAAITNERMLTGPEKAAALLLMMGKPPAARLLKQFDQPDLQAVARAAAGLGAVPATTLDRLVDEFATDFSAGADLFSDVGQVKNSACRYYAACADRGHSRRAIRGDQ